MKHSNFLITGQRHAGKSSLIAGIYEEFQVTPCGFVTLPDFDKEGRRIGFLYHSLSPVFFCEGKEVNNLPISRGKQPVTDTFDSLGCACLKGILQDSCPYVLTDEAGRFEKNQKEYIDLLNKVLDSGKFVLVSLKKEDIPYIQKIKKRKDVRVLDLDTMSYSRAYHILTEAFLQYKI